MSQDRGPVQAKSLSSQQGTAGAPVTSTSTSQPIDPSYYSSANPFAAPPVEDESGPRQDRYWRDRMNPESGSESSNYGGSGMRARLMTA